MIDTAPVIIPSSVSIAVAPSSVYVHPRGIITEPLPLSVITGSHPATTLIILFSAAILPLESVTVYVPVYVPIVLASSNPVKVIPGVRFPSSVSSAVAPESEYTDHLIRVYGLSQRIDITGALPVITLMVRVTVTVLLLESVTV